MKPSILSILIAFALVENAQAVSPPPDGGYPGGDTAEGQNTVKSLTTGIYNPAVGIYSGLSLSDGSFCTGVGAGALLANNADPPQFCRKASGGVCSRSVHGWFCHQVLSR